MDKNNTGFAAEFIVVAELARRDFNVANHIPATLF